MSDWKTIDFGKGNYEISKQGVVRNKTTGKTISNRYNTYGYAFVNLYDSGRTGTKLISRLLCDAFQGGLKRGFVVDHIDEDKTNNDLSNLQQISYRENVIRSKKRQPKSGKRGVCWHAGGNMWKSRFRFQGKLYEKYFNDLDEAGQWYEEMTKAADSF